MALYSLKDHVSLTPWNDLQEWFLKQPDSQKLFRRQFSKVTGPVIAWWKLGALSPPTQYLRFVLPGWQYQMDEELSIRQGCFEWSNFGNDNDTENPRQYATLKKNLQIIAGLREIFEDPRIGLIFWVHPESFYQPQDQYVRMSEGNEFEGSPRQ